MAHYIQIYRTYESLQIDNVVELPLKQIHFRVGHCHKKEYARVK
jgi:hypothetical protein